MDQASSALLRLNLDTRPYHAAADAGWLALLHRELTQVDYLDWLVKVYGFESALESALERTPAIDLFVDLRTRARAGLLAKDLFALGLQAHEVMTMPRCSIAPFGGPLEALGWMYVNERATLLHDRVRRHVLARLPDAHEICAYVSAYDGITNARWNELGHILDRAVRSERRMHELIAASRAAFEMLTAWTGERSYACGA